MLLAVTDIEPSDNFLINHFFVRNKMETYVIRVEECCELDALGKWVAKLFQQMADMLVEYYHKLDDYNYY